MIYRIFFLFRYHSKKESTYEWPQHDDGIHRDHRNALKADLLGYLIHHGLSIKGKDNTDKVTVDELQERVAKHIEIDSESILRKIARKRSPLIRVLFQPPYHPELQVCLTFYFFIFFNLIILFL